MSDMEKADYSTHEQFDWWKHQNKVNESALLRAAFRGGAGSVLGTDGIGRYTACALPEDPESDDEIDAAVRALQDEVAASTAECQRLRGAIERALAEFDSGTGWGPDVTACAHLREALNAG